MSKAIGLLNEKRRKIFNYMQNWQIEKLCINCVARVKVTFIIGITKILKYFALLSNNFTNYPHCSFHLQTQSKQQSLSIEKINRAQTGMKFIRQMPFVQLDFSAWIKPIMNKYRYTDITQCKFCALLFSTALCITNHILSFDIIFDWQATPKKYDKIWTNLSK